MLPSTNTTHALPDITGYVIVEQLYLGSRTAVYRATQAAQPRLVVIKTLRHDYPSFSELVQFRNQYAIAKNLDIPGVVQPLRLDAFSNGYALVMEDFGGISLRQFSQGKSLSVEQFFAISLQVTAILDQIHQQRVIHKDIKPANILIHPHSQQVKLIDFSIASLLPREIQEIQNPNVLEGTLAYLSPEQTGRMNRGIDYRSDFYSLGMTFFELLTGQLPFQAENPMELLHCHLAKQPPSACDLNAELPLMLGEIIRKLMAKNAEDRYQSTLGLKHDLMRCQEEYQVADKHVWFELGQRDACDRFLIPEKLYGRETEVQILLDAFGRVANGASELMLVAGFSGIGKTAVVNEVHKPIVRWNGYFIKGKFDQFNRNIPLSAFVQALRDLIGQLLSESDEQLEQWRTQILATVGENGQVLLEVLPELEQIIGKQLAVSALAGSAAQNRFNLLFQNFIAVFTTLEHPLVMFLDDLQWADSASLSLMKLLISESDRGYLFIIGAYRDNEVFPAHPLMLTLEDLQKAGATLNTLTLTPLSQQSLNELVADTLHCALDLAQPLTQLVYQKTQGNPFFVFQFLKALHEDGWIAFERQAGYWQCDIATVRSLALTDDVVEFMAQQLQKLPNLTQNILKLAACIGNQFDLATLAIVSEKSQTETASDLWKALQEGFIIPNNEIYKFYQDSSLVIDHLQRTNDNGQRTVYKFLHDRVQQAAYSLIPDDQKQATHLKIGQLLLQKTSLNDRGEKLFDIVNHFNVGQPLITQPSQCHELAQLNLAAGRKARAATAYSAALAYFMTGIELLPSDRWQQEYQLSLALYEGATEAAYLSTDFEQMEQLAATVLTHAHSWLDRLPTYQAKIQAYIAQNQHLEALRLAQEVLNQLGVYLPEEPTEVEIMQGLQHTQTLLGNRAIESWLELPEMTAPEQKAAMTILSNIMSVAYQVAPNLLPLLIFVQVDLSVQYGNTTESTYSYVMYGLMLVAMLKDIDAGYRFGQLGMNLLQRIDAPKLAAKTIFGFNNSLRHWQEPAKDTLTGYLQAYASGLETGDLEYVALSLMCYSYTAYFSGVQLSTLKQTMDEHRKVIQQFRQNGYFRLQSIYYQAVLNLLEPTAQPDRLCSKDYDEDEMIQLHLQANQLVALYQIYFNKLLLSYLFHRYEQAVLNARLTEQYMGAAAGLMHVPLFSFYDALVRLAIYPTASETEQAAILDRVSVHQEKLQEWASYAPSNQAQRWALVAAERCRVLGEKANATDLYDRAIALAKEHDYIQEEALANELAAKFYLDWGKERIAQEYMIEAYYGYAHWGATAKVADLECRYPRLLAPVLQQPRSAISVNETVFATGTVASTSSSSSISDSLDLAAILKISQTLASEIELDRLLSTLLRTVIQTAGANKCVLMLLEHEQLNVQAIAALTATHQIEVEVLITPVLVQESYEVPISLINSVKRSLQPAVIMDAALSPQFAADAYIQTRQIKSLLCSPILRQGKLLGMIYLENNVAMGAFTNDRVELFNLLCAQAAISLENARLYQQSQHYAQQLERSLKGQELLYDVVSDIRRSLDVETIFTVVTQQVRQTLNADRVGIYQFDLASAYNEGVMVAEAVLPAFPSTLQVRAQDHCFGERYAAFYRQGRVYALSDLKQVKVEACYRELLEQFAVKANLIAPILWRGDLWGLLCVHQCQHPRNWTTEEIQFTKQIAVQLSVALEQAKLLSQTHEQATQLEQTLTELQNAQLQIVQSEKMSALGNLVAGVAHEINNPVGFIAGNLQPALDYVKDTFGLLDLYQQEYPHPGATIQDEIAAIDLDYVREDLPKLIGSMQLGVDRIRSISTSLRTFSRADKDYKVSFNIHEGIDSTILILKHRLKASDDRPAIEVITDYGNLPQVECFPGQLNQVFMNILANAIDMFDESAQTQSLEQLKTKPQKIIIQTVQMEDQVLIRIRDNGKGIPEAARAKIFDHLFTTKAVGKGTGLGLTIARQIVVENHDGRLEVQSKLGQGTEFSISLPLGGSASQPA